MKAIIIAAAAWALCAATAQAQSNSAVNGITVIPSQPGTTVQPFGRGAIIRQPGQSDAHVQPFGRGVIIHEPGKPSVQCMPFGSTVQCR